MLVTETHFSTNSSTFKPIFSATQTSSTFINGGRKGKGGIAGYLRDTHDPANVQILFIDKDSYYAIFLWKGVTFGLGYFSPDSMEAEAKMYSMLEQTSLFANGGPSIALGDFNARMGEVSGDTTMNPRGRRLASYLEENGGEYSLQIPESGRFTSFGSNGGMGVTDIVLCGGGVVCRSFVVHEQETLGGSDHRPLTFEVPDADEGMHFDEERKFVRYNVRRFLEAGIIDQYQESLNSTYGDVVEHFGRNQNDIEECWTIFKEWIDKAARASIGMFKFQRRPHFAPGYFTREMTDLQKKITAKEKEIWELRRERVAQPVIAAVCVELKQLHLDFKEISASRKRDLFHKHVDELSNPQQAGSFLRMVKGLKAAKGKKGCQLDPTKMAEHEGHFYKTFGAELPELPFVVEPPVFQGYVERPVGSETIKSIISNLALGKAPGCDGFPGEFYYYGGESMVRVVAELITRVLSNASVPADWRCANIVPVFKDKGDITKMENYRPIALTPVIRRICEQVLILDLSREMSCLHDLQGGFRRNRSTLDQVFCLHEMMVSNPDTHVILLDFKAAYDTVDRRLLWHKLRHEFHVPEPMIYMLSVLFDHNVSTILINNTASAAIPNAQGLLQGSSLSPLLFNFFINSLACRLNNGTLPQLRAPGLSANSLLFADDAALLAKSFIDASCLMAVAEEWARMNNMRFAPNKCVHIAPTSEDSDEDDDDNLTLYGQNIPKSASAKYLGMWINSSGVDFEKSVTERTSKANGVAALLSEVGMNGNGWVYSSSTLAYKMFIRSVMEYGIALQPLEKKLTDMLEKCQSSALRRILGAPSQTSRAAMHTVLQVEPMAHRNLVLNAQFTARLHNNNDKAIPAVRIWWAKSASGKQKPGKGSKLNPANVNREVKSLVQAGIFRNTLWSKATHESHLTTQLHHPRIVFGLSAADTARIKMPVAIVKKAFTAAQKQSLKRQAIIDLKDFKPGSIAAALELDHTEGLRAICLPNPDISRKDRLVIMRWLLGLVCQHQTCASCQGELDREHGLVCAEARAWAENYLLEDYPEAFEERPGRDPKATWLDGALNTLRHSRDQYVIEGLSQTIQLILIKCRDLEQQDNGYWKPRDRPDSNGQAAKWSQTLQSQHSNDVVYHHVQNPAQTARRAIVARQRNRQSGKPTANNPHRQQVGSYQPQQQRFLPTTVRTIVDEEDDYQEESEMERDNTCADASLPCATFSSKEVFNGAMARASVPVSQRDLFGSEAEMQAWASGGLEDYGNSRQSSQSSASQKNRRSEIRNSTMEGSASESGQASQGVG
jgi:hypothetical protein